MAGEPIAVAFVAPPEDMGDVCPHCERPYQDGQLTEAQPPPRDYGKVFELLTVGAPDALTVGRRTLCLAYLLKAPGCPRTLAELGAVLGVSRQMAHKRLTTFRALLPEIAREINFAG